MTPKYTMRRMELTMLCDTPEATACLDAVMARDAGGARESDFWGHPAHTVLASGTTVLRLPVNVRNMAVLHECGARPDTSDPETARRIAFFCRKAPAQFATTLPLKPFQVEGCAWLDAHDMRGTLADQVGLGKTLQTIAVMRAYPERFFPAVVLAPAHLKLNWGDPDNGEWVKWGGASSDVAVLFGRTPDRRQIEGKKLVVLNHHILEAWADDLAALTPKTLVIDEAHSFVNSNTKTYGFVKRLAEISGRVLLLTATPFVNNLGDLWGLANLINPDILGLKGVYNETFLPEEKAKAALFSNRWRSSFSMRDGWRQVAKARLPKQLQERRIDELSDLFFRTFMLRRKKSDVIDQLPAVTETHLRIDVPTTTKEGRAFWAVEAECERILKDAKEDALASDQMLAADSRYRKNAVTAKLPSAEEWIADFLNESDEKLVVVGWSVEPLETLYGKFKKNALLVNGMTDARKKREHGTRFAEDADKRVMFGNIKSIGTGIDLVAARTMLFIELPKTGVELEQAKGRIDRLSQKSNGLAYYYMTVRDSLEERKGWSIIRRKQAISTRLGM